MKAGVVVFAVGNRSRGDDAVGPWLLDRLAAWLARRTDTDDFELIDDFQLQIEHALDLADRRLALFVDAGVGTAAPFDLSEIAADASFTGHTTHALAPASVLGVYRCVTGAPPPPAFVLCVRGESFELGDPISARAQAHAESAWQTLAALCARPDAAHWRAIAACRMPGCPALRHGPDVSAVPRRSSRQVPG
jgi:hydrogenase maturation protease